ncbi:MAG: PEP/pyruvate-binding domain-containing protein [Oscillospiraceae bacterium]|nr:PEP/pyruvate-binding domain-containing protein [Oscillospiraceae bacterium]
MILSSQSHTAEAFAGCGAKAFHLARMREAGFPVPPFVCLEPEDRQAAGELPDLLRREGISGPYAVRSSAAAEDGETASYAGQFATYLFVPEEEVAARAGDCFEKLSALRYPGETAPQKARCVIVQQMVEPEISGVLFTQNPLGILSEAVVVAGAGAGNGVVEDKVPTATYYRNRADGLGYHICQEGAPEMPIAALEELLELGQRLETLLGPGLDVEFALQAGRLWLLQARRITTLPEGRRVVLDNSNIVESYPGLTCPLTADFVSRQYTAIFRGVVTRLSGSGKIARRYGERFAHMVECCNGRMYYRIENWYGVIGLLPFSKKIVPVWQEMLGVRQETAKTDLYRISPWQKASIALHTLYYFFRATAKMAQLQRCMEEAEDAFQALPRDAGLEELGALYRRLTALVMEKWDYTLINDMYTFLHTALFRAAMRRRGAPEEQLQSALASAAYLASLQPVKRLLELALEWKKNGESACFSEGFAHYLERYGDRSVGELKIETETFREFPEKLQKQIEQFAALPNLETLLKSLGAPAKKGETGGLAGFFLARARLGVENRERSRMDRTRLFGFARSVFLRAGEILRRQGRLDEGRDVFYLTIDELFAPDGADLRPRVQERRRRFAAYAGYPAYSRLVFAGEIIEKPCLTAKLRQDAAGPLAMQGVPCSFGKACGEVALVEDAQEAGDLSGKIVVTHSTDPGWAFLIVGAAGVISEKGSLLSHTAIVAREMHIPMIAAVAGAMSRLQNGDRVEMDCASGTVTVVEKAAPV